MPNISPEMVNAIIDTSFVIAMISTILMIALMIITGIIDAYNELLEPLEEKAPKASKIHEQILIGPNTYCQRQTHVAYNEFLERFEEYEQPEENR
jgi:hypothetical protein